MSRKPVPAQTGDRARLEVLFDKPQLLGRLFGEY
ncbi:MAG: phosphate starvation protein PhoH, partial [Sphingomonas bacterium]|nr:phosphate starvation protein PhoH [Sphingomonas bacterium]